MFCAVARFFRPGYRTNLVDQWLPAMALSASLAPAAPWPM
jgi:hypothetical protein